MNNLKMRQKLSYGAPQKPAGNNVGKRTNIQLKILGIEPEAIIPAERKRLVSTVAEHLSTREGTGQKKLAAVLAKMPKARKEKFQKILEARKKYELDFANLCMKKLKIDPTYIAAENRYPCVVKVLHESLTSGDFGLMLHAKRIMSEVETEVREQEKHYKKLAEEFTK